MHTTTDTHRTISTFVEFYRERGHTRLVGSSLVPAPGDPVLFTSAGMHPLTPYLEGRPHPHGRRLVSLQRCLRTTDLDEVGDATHLTVFGMLGSWSLGDYDGQQSLRWAYELLTDGFGIEPGRLHATVFGGDEHVGPDVSSQRTWDELGVPVEPGVADNWWSNGPTGICGPDSEIFVWTGTGPPSGRPSSDQQWVEVWNHVMLRLDRGADGRLTDLAQPNVDTGLGLERLAMVLQGRSTVYETDLLRPWVVAVERLWRLPVTPLRLVVDHVRSAVVISGDGVEVSNAGRGYVLRRLVRRALTELWRHHPDATIADLDPELMSSTLVGFEHAVDPGPVRQAVLGEERRFRSLLERGRPIVERRLRRSPAGLTAEDLAYLRETHGLPADLVLSLTADLDRAAR